MSKKFTDNFKSTILRHLTIMANNDPLFRASFQKPNKNIDECINYILTAIKASGIQGYTDEEVYAMAMHYYDEDDIKNVKSINCQVVVNHTVKLTEEEIKEQKEKALQDVYKEQQTKMTTKAKPKEKPIVAQQSLF